MAMNDEKRRKQDLSIQGQAATQATRYLGPAAGAAVAASPSQLATPARPELASTPAAVQYGARVRDTATRLASGAQAVAGKIADVGGGYLRTLTTPLRAAADLTAQAATGAALAPGQTPAAAAASPAVPRPATAGYGGAGGASSYGVARTPTGTPVAATAARRPPAATSAAPAPQPGDLNTFTGADGTTRRISAAPTAAQGDPGAAGATQTGLGAPSRGLSTPTPMATPGAAQAQARNRGVNARASQFSAEQFTDPRSSANELLRRMNTALGGRQTASERRAKGAAFGEIIRGLVGGSQIAQQGAEGAIADANRTAGALALAQQQGADALTRQVASDQATAARQLVEQNAPQQFIDSSGSAFVREGRTLTPITGPDGQQARIAVPAAPGQVTPEVQFKALSDQLKALQHPDAIAASGEPGSDQRAAYEAEVANLRAQMEALSPRSSQAGAGAVSIEQFLARAKQQGSKMTEEQLRAAYAEQFGSR